jgi:hypothetical protein
MFIRIIKIPAKKITIFSELNYVSPGEQALTKRYEKDTSIRKNRRRKCSTILFPGIRTGSIKKTIQHLFSEDPDYVYSFDPTRFYVSQYL